MHKVFSGGNDEYISVNVFILVGTTTICAGNKITLNNDHTSNEANQEIKPQILGFYSPALIPFRMLTIEMSCNSVIGQHTCLVGQHTCEPLFVILKHCRVSW